MTNALRVYSLLTGEKFEKTMQSFDTNKVLHFAKVSIDKKPFDFLLLSKDVLSTSTNTYFIVNEEEQLVYSNLDDEQSIIAYMYTLLMKNLEAYQDDTVQDLFAEEDILSKVKTMQRRMSNDIKDSLVIHYVDDYNVIPNYPKLKFASYLLDHTKLSDLYNIVFEQRHISFFQRLSPLKESFKEFKRESNGVEELRSEGIYIDKLQHTSFMDSLKEKDHILLTGPTGSGKSTIMFHILRQYTDKYLTIECNESKKYTDLFGSLTLITDANGKQALAPSLGKIALAYRDGLPLVLEEFTALNEKNFKALLTMMQHDELTLEIDNEVNGEMVKSITIPRHKDFFIIATANEEKRYNVNTLTPQVKRRFATVLPINYLPEDLEVEFIEHRLNAKGKHLEADKIELLVRVGNNLRNKKLVVSTATLAIWAEKSSLYGVRDAAVCHFVPQIVYSKQDLRAVNDMLSLEFPNHEPIEIAI